MRELASWAASLASLRDAGTGEDGVPVVSLRSTTGYWLISLRDRQERIDHRSCSDSARDHPVISRTHRQSPTARRNSSICSSNRDTLSRSAAISSAIAVRD